MSRFLTPVDVQIGLAGWCSEWENMFYIRLRSSISQVVVVSLNLQSPGALKGLGVVWLILGGRGVGGFEILSAGIGSGTGSTYIDFLS